MGRYQHKLFAFVLAVIGLVLLYARYRYLHIPFERDEGEYAYAGSLLLHGHQPYREAYNMKFPGSYFMYALFMKTGGETIEGVRTGIYFIVLLTAFITAAITKLITKNYIAAAVAGLCFFALDNTMGHNGLLANSEHFVNLFVAGGIFSLLLYRKNGRTAWLFAAGFMLSAAVIMKQYGYPFCLLGLAVIFTLNRGKSFLAQLKPLLLYGLGGALPVILLLVWLVHYGLYDKFRFLTIDYAYAYLQLGDNFNDLHKSYFRIIVLALLFLILRSSEARFIIAWLICSILAYSTGVYLRPHYYILAFPAQAVALGYLFYIAAKYLGFKPTAIGACLAFAYCFYTHRGEQFTKAPLEVFKTYYRSEVFADMPEVAAHINKYIPATDKLSIFSEEPELLFYSHHVAASGYIYCYPLFEQQPYAMQMVKEFITEVEANPSRLFIYNNTWQRTNHASYQYFDDWWNQYQKNFELKEVYFAMKRKDGKFIDKEQIKNDSSYLHAGIRFEFWMRKQ